MQDGMGKITSIQYDSLGRITKETNPDLSYKSYTYNNTENSVTVTDENGNQIKYEYDGFGNLLHQKDITSGEILQSYTYDEKFRKKSQNNHNSAKITWYSYGSDGRIIAKEIKDSIGTKLYKETYIYNDASDSGQYNKVTKITEGDAASPSITTVSYTDKYGLAVKQGRVHEGIEYLDTFVYNYLGNKIEEKSARAYDEAWTEGYTAKYQYDHAGNVVKQYNINGDYITTGYDALGRITTVTDIKGGKASPIYSTTYEYDKLGRSIKEMIPFEDVSSSIYYTVKKHYYDRNSNTVCEKISDNLPGEAESFSSVEYEYNGRNMLTGVITFDADTPENYTQYHHDAVGNKLRMYTGLSVPLTINGLDNITENGDSDYSVTKYEYDRFGNMTKITDAIGNYETYSYDLNANITGKVDRNENISTYSNDGMRRVLSQTVTTPDSLGDVSYTYTYTLIDKRASMSGGSIDTTYTYDDLGRLVSEAESNGITKEYSYDTADNRTTFILKQNDVEVQNTSYTYDKLNRLNQVLNSSQVKATYTYDDNGNRATLTYDNGNITEYQYNLTNMLTQLTNKEGTNILSQYIYTYYLDGNQDSKTEAVTGKSSEYAYDGLGRLTAEIEKENEVLVSSVSYTYDDCNNRESMTVSGGAVTAYQYDLNNRLLIETKVTGSTTETTRYTYDHNGNQICKAAEILEPDIGQQEEYGIYVLGEDIETEIVTINQYNGLNQLALTISGDISAEYTYNADGFRRSKTVNNNTITHVWDGSNIVLELNNSGEIYAKYIRGINLIYSDTGTVSYYLFNAHGDVVQLTGNDGTLIKTYKYDAFGNEESPDSADNNPFRYCGEYFDKETGTIYLRARYYNPAIGRFITEDSYLGNNIDPLSLNLYTYCNNEPIMYKDPTGYWGEAAAVYLTTGWTVNFIPVYGQVAYVVGWVGVGIYEVVSSPIFPAVCDWTANVAAPWVSNAVNDAGDWISDNASRGWDWLKEQFGGSGSPNIDPNDFNRGFESFRKLKKYLGSPGKGNHWHHLVEQSQIKKSGFEATKIHNTNNIISISKEVHQKITGYYNSIDSTLSETMRVRDWLAGKSFDVQIKFGIKVLKRFLNNTQ